MEARGVEPLSHDKFTGRDYMLSPGRVVGSWIAPGRETNRVVSMDYFGGIARCPRAPPNLLQRSSPEQVCGENVVALRPREPILR